MPACVSSASQPKRSRKLSENAAKKLIRPGLIILLVLASDQLTKIWAVEALTDSPSIEVLGRFMMFTLVYNYGGAMGTNLGSSTYYLVISFLLIPMVFYYIYYYRSKSGYSLPLAFIAGGALGNILDRVRLGRVVDFIDVDFINIDLFGFQLQRWWTFNIADAAISLAILYLLFISFLKPAKREPSTESIPEPSDQIS